MHQSTFALALLFAAACSTGSPPTALDLTAYNADDFAEFIGADEVPAALEDVADLVSGLDHSCAMMVDGLVWCWDVGGEAAQVLEVDGAASIAAGDSHTCAVDFAGRVWCWGSNVDYALGCVSCGPDERGALFLELLDIVHLDSLGATTCAASPDGIWCWGGRMGVSPFYLDVFGGLGGFVEVSVGEGDVCAVTAEGETWCADDGAAATSPG